MVNEYQVISEGRLKGIVEEREDGWAYARDGVNFDRVAQPTAAHAVPLSRGSYELRPIQ